MLDYISLFILYSIYLCLENIYNGFILNQIIRYMHERNVELANFEHEIPDKYYYFQDENGNIELRAPIFIPINE